MIRRTALNDFGIARIVGCEETTQGHVVRSPRTPRFGWTINEIGCERRLACLETQGEIAVYVREGVGSLTEDGQRLSRASIPEKGLSECAHCAGLLVRFADQFECGLEGFSVLGPVS